VSSVKIGIMVANQPVQAESPRAVADRLIAQVRHADRWGFETAVFTEHHQQEGGYFPSPLVSLAAISTVTSRIRLATGVLLAPLYDPFRLAEDVALIDLFSKGRVSLGIGAGYAPVDFAPFGASLKERGRRIDELLDILGLAWSGERFTYEGRYTSYEDVLLSPAPFQSGGPPIWVGGRADVAMRRAALRGNGWIGGISVHIGWLAEQADRYREFLGERDDGQPGEVTVLREGWVSQSRSEALRVYADGVMPTHEMYYKYGLYKGDPYGESLDSADQLTIDGVADDRFVIGSPDAVLEELHRYRDEVGADRVVLRLGHPGGPAHEQVMEAIELMGREVIPHLSEGS